MPHVGFVLPYLLLCREDAGQREHDVREVFNAVRYVARSGCAWRLIKGDLPPRAAVYQQFRRWLEAGVFEALVADVQSIVREWAGRKGQPTAVCLDSRTLQWTPESGSRAGYDGDKRRKGSKVHIAVDTLGHLLALKVTAASEGHREQVAALAADVQQVTGNPVELPMWIRAIPAITLRKPPAGTASTLNWSSTPWPSEASFCCHDGEPWREASPGPPDSEGSPETTNGSQTHSKAYTSSPPRSS